MKYRIMKNYAGLFYVLGKNGWFDTWNAMNDGQRVEYFESQELAEEAIKRVIKERAGLEKRRAHKDELVKELP